MSARPPFKALAVVLLPPLLALAFAAAMVVFAAGAAQQAGLSAAQLASARARLPPDPDREAAARLIAGATPGLQASAFQARILSIAAAADLDVDLIEAREPSLENGLVRLHAQASFSGTEAQMMRAVIAFEAAVPLIFLDRMQLNGDNEDGGLLRAEIVFSAYARAEAP